MKLFVTFDKRLSLQLFDIQRLSKNCIEKYKFCFLLVVITRWTLKIMNGISFLWTFVVILFRVLLLSFAIISVITIHRPSAKRALVFEDFRSRAKLTSSHLYTYRDTSKTTCLQICVKTRECLSVNACDYQICELNSGDVFSINSVLQTDQDGEYFGMLKNDTAKCSHKGQSTDIRDDSVLNFCQIDGKRIDGEWITGKREDVRENSTYWEKVLLPECFEGSHGGKTCEGGGDPVVLEWVRGVSETLDWDDAKANCEGMGGKLFDELDGTLHQLKFLSSKVGGGPFFLGIWTDDKVAYKNSLGEIVPASNIFWDSSSPSGDGYVAEGYWHGVNDLERNHSRASVCQFRKS